MDISEINKLLAGSRRRRDLLELREAIDKELGGGKKKKKRSKRRSDHEVADFFDAEDASTSVHDED